MNKILGAGFLCIALALLIKSFDFIYEEKSGLHLDPPSVNFGQINQGQRLTASFNLINHSDKTFKILEIIKSCNCSDAKFASEVILPSTKSEISIVWDSSAFRGKTNQKIGVLVEDQKDSAFKRTLFVDILADVKPEVRFEPDKIVWDGVTKKEIVVKFSSETGKKINVINVNPGFNNVTWQKTDSSKTNEATILLEPNPQSLADIPDGREFWIDVHLANVQFPWVKVPGVVSRNLEDK